MAQMLRISSKESVTNCERRCGSDDPKRMEPRFLRSMETFLRRPRLFVVAHRWRSRAARASMMLPCGCLDVLMRVARPQISANNGRRRTNGSQMQNIAASMVCFACFWAASASIGGCVRVSSSNELRLVPSVYEASGGAPRMWYASRLVA